ncbi:MAG: DEAD/DEAH box helicase [Cellulomonadaceae bacterium]|nr:DEAD/DEAH box helicase [Cellulomonadaceae bacterium]
MDIQYGYIGIDVEYDGPRNYGPRMVLNQDGGTIEHVLLAELGKSTSFTFSVAFVSPGAIAQLKQRLVDYDGTGRIITSDFLGFNQPRAFAELLHLAEHAGIEVRRHTAKGFHPKGYIFDRGRSVTAMIGSSNLTSSALSQNHEWNLMVSAAAESDLAAQLRRLVDEQVASSEPLTQEWIDDYAATYVAPPRRSRAARAPDGEPSPDNVEPNAMQQDALLALDLARAEGARRAIIISATGTGKTILSALDVRAVNPGRLLFVVHREQILDRTIQEYRRVLGGSASDYGKLAGQDKRHDRRYVFATVQTLSQPAVLSDIDPRAFDYVIIDEAHRAGAQSYQRVIEHLAPRFLLGMTATPERTDGFNVFELFHFVVPYEIRLSHALDAGMLAPFHYYGIADVTYDDGSSTPGTDVGRLITPERVAHLLRALDVYGQAGVAPRGLVFCSSKDEAHALSNAMNKCPLRGRKLRTLALTSDDAVNVRERAVEELEAGRLDYILTVDIFNEGVDIPTINQVVMLRPTQSAIVFVQQLGRGLRRAEGKDHLVVIDVIGNYANSFLIPVALFGDESLNRESLRERLNETVDAGALPGLSSVSFDEVSRSRVLASIVSTKLDSMSNLRTALVAMSNRVGGVPALWDFYRFESVDPILLATKREHYPALVRSLLREEHRLGDDADRALSLLSHEVLAAKRVHELVLVELLVERGAVTFDEITRSFEERGLPSDELHVRTAVDTVALRGYPQSDVTRYRAGIAEEAEGLVRATASFDREMKRSATLRTAVDDLLRTGLALTEARYARTSPFTPGMQYSRRDAARIVGWPRSAASTVYGYKTDEARGVCTIFVTLHKAGDVDASTAYADALLDPTTMRWFSKNNRSLRSRDVRPIVEGRVVLHVFVQKDDAEGPDHYYLGHATAHDAVETTMRGNGGVPLPVVVMTLRFKTPVRQGLFDYFHPSAPG